MLEFRVTVRVRIRILGLSLGLWFGLGSGLKLCGGGFLEGLLQGAYENYTHATVVLTHKQMTVKAAVC